MGGTAKDPSREDQMLGKIKQITAIHKTHKCSLLKSAQHLGFPCPTSRLCLKSEYLHTHKGVRTIVTAEVKGRKPESFHQ